MRVEGSRVALGEAQRPMLRLKASYCAARHAAARRCFAGDSLPKADAAKSAQAPGLARRRKHGLRQMTCKISRSVFAMALAIGMLAALSNPSSAALSSADRTNAVAATAPAPEQATVAAVSTQQPATPAGAPAPARGCCDGSGHERGGRAAAQDCRSQSHAAAHRLRSALRLSLPLSGFSKLLRRTPHEVWQAPSPFVSEGALAHAPYVRARKRGLSFCRRASHAPTAAPSTAPSPLR